MIGDFVRVNRDGLCIKKDTIVEIRSIDTDNNFPEKGLFGCASCRPLDGNQFNGGVWLDYLDPIPLTPEILEKNGFRHPHRPTTSDGCESFIDEEYVWGEEGKRNFTVVTITFYKGLSNGVRVLTKIETDCSHESGINMIHSCDIEYVHQLQHALRLCGIEKDIEL